MTKQHRELIKHAAERKLRRRSSFLDRVFKTERRTVEPPRQQQQPVQPPLLNR